MPRFSTMWFNWWWISAYQISVGQNPTHFILSVYVWWVLLVQEQIKLGHVQNIEKYKKTEILSAAKLRCSCLSIYSFRSVLNIFGCFLRSWDSKHFENTLQFKKNKNQASAPDENIVDGLGYMNPSYDPPSYADALK